MFGNRRPVIVKDDTIYVGSLGEYHNDLAQKVSTGPGSLADALYGELYGSSFNWLYGNIPFDEEADEPDKKVRAEIQQAISDAGIGKPEQKSEDFRLAREGLIGEAAPLSQVAPEDELREYLKYLSGKDIQKLDATTRAAAWDKSTKDLSLTEFEYVTIGTNRL